MFIFITAGDPDFEMTRRLAPALEQAGADLIELGVSFSDPMADGPVIQRASERALSAGATLSGVLKLVKEVRAQTEIPLALMTYYNPVFRYGLAEIAADARAAGVDGMIIPDLPFEENRVLRDEMMQYGLCLIPLVAPTSTNERLTKIGETAQGFVYCVSLTGVTGMRDGVPLHLEKFIGRARRCITQPLAIGFGISNPRQAALMAELGDAVIVGSAVVNLVEQHAGQPEVMVAQITGLVRELKEAIKRSPV